MLSNWQLHHSPQAYNPLSTISAKKLSPPAVNDMQKSQSHSDMRNIGKATEGTAMELDRESTANYDQIEDLIQKECNKKDCHHAALEEKYKRLKHDLITTSNKQQINMQQRCCTPTNNQDCALKKNKSDPNTTSTPR